MTSRDLAPLTASTFDLLVVGGGIHGLFAAYDAATRGFSVALVDAGDFGGGLSFNHQRTIHGGLRALETAQLLKAREQLRERRTWARIAPHLIQPLPFLVGTYRFSRRSRLGVRTAFAVYDLLGRDRNAGVWPELRVPRTRIESVAATRRLFPGIRTHGLSGGAIWYDYQARHPDRISWTVALAAQRAGAVTFNYVEALGPLRDANRIAGARVRDVVTGEELDVRAGVTLLAAGSRLPDTMTRFGVSGAPPFVRAMNLLLDRPARDIALVAPGRTGRMLTAVPWRDRLLVGTYQSATPIAGPEPGPPVEALTEMLSEVNAAFPALGVSRAEIRLVHHGLTPAVVRHGRASLLPDPIILDHSAQGVPGLVSLIGVKFTTARRAAELAVDVVARRLERPRHRCRTADAPLPHAHLIDSLGRVLESAKQLGLSLNDAVIEHLAGWYGSEASAVLEFSAETGLADRLSANTPVLAGEIAYAVVRAQAIHLTDAVLRRTPLGSAGHPGRRALLRAAQIMGAVRRWTRSQLDEEIALVEDRYPSRPLGDESDLTDGDHSGSA